MGGAAGQKGGTEASQPRSSGHSCRHTPAPWPPCRPRTAQRTDPAAHFARALPLSPGLAPLWDLPLLGGSTCKQPPPEEQGPQTHTHHTHEHARTPPYCAHTRTHAPLITRTHRNKTGDVGCKLSTAEVTLQYKLHENTAASASPFVGNAPEPVGGLALGARQKAPSSPWSPPVRS